MIDKNENNNIELGNLRKEREIEKNNLVSFSEYDKDGNFRETIGYFVKDESDLTLEERVEEFARRLGKK